MPLNIRDPRATELARELAEQQGTTMTAVIVDLLEREVKRRRDEVPLEVRLKALAEKAQRMAGPNPREMTKEEIDDLWTAE
jgi:antitoxin VapB